MFPEFGLVPIKIAISNMGIHMNGFWLTYYYAYKIRHFPIAI